MFRPSWLPSFSLRHAKSRSSRGTLRSSRLHVELLEDRTLPSTFTVFNTQDSGAGSLRQAIIDANNSLNVGGPDTIKFAIPATDANHLYYKNDGVAGQVSTEDGNGNSLIAATAATDDSTIADIDPDWSHSWWSIQPVSALSAISEAVTIDGYSQGWDQGVPGPQAAIQNSNGSELGINAVLRIELNGAAAIGGVTGGFTLLASAGGKAQLPGPRSPLFGDSTTIQGLVINNFTSNGISQGGSAIWAERVFQSSLAVGGGHHIAGNFLGTDPSGTLDQGNAGSGVAMNGASFNVVGTNGDLQNDVAERNLISGNEGLSGEGAAISLRGSGDNKIAGNLVGTDRTGTRALGNSGQAITIYGTSAFGNIIGTNGDEKSDALERNIISAATGPLAAAAHPWAIQVRDSGQRDTVIAGNYIGVDVTGTNALGNALWGVLLGFTVHHNRIGTNADGKSDELERNVISGNGRGGVALALNTFENDIWGNTIGADKNGQPLPGGPYQVDFGIAVGTGANSNEIGGPGAKANLFAHNGGPGVTLVSAVANRPPTIPTSVPDAAGNANAIRFNSIHSNGGLGIDLGGVFDWNTFLHAADGITTSGSDPLDADSGPNGFQNYPVITAGSFDATTTTVSGSLASVPNQTYTLDFYVSPEVDSSGHGEGKYYVGSHTVATDGNGLANFNNLVFSSPAVSGDAIQFITATATDPAGSTSEFSLAFSLNALTVFGTGGNDAIAVTKDSANVKVMINGIDIGTYAGPDTISILGLDGDDTMTISATGTQELTADGQNGSDRYIIQFGVGQAALAATVTLHDSGVAGFDELQAIGTREGDSIVKSPTQITLTLSATDQTINYDESVEGKFVDGREGNDTITNGAPQSPANCTLIGGDGDDTFIIYGAMPGDDVIIDGQEDSDVIVVYLGNLASPVVVSDSGTRGSDSLTVNGTTSADAVTVALTQVTRLTDTIRYNATIENLFANAGAGQDEITITGASSSTVVLNGGEDADTFKVGNLGASSMSLTIDGGTGTGDQVVVQGSLPPGATIHRAALQVGIDVLRGSSPFNLASQGMIAVAILSTSSFNAAQVDPSSVLFADARAVHYELRDVNFDGRLDLVLNFRIQDTTLMSVYQQLLADDLDGDGILDSNHQIATVSLTGRTLDNTLITGFDTMNLFLSGKPLRDLLAQLAFA